MITLRPLQPVDLGIIREWPPYQGDMEQMDYALRQDGWLSHRSDKAVEHLFVAEMDGDPVAFTILTETAPGDAEIRIALRADRTGMGLGGEIMRLTLDAGFRCIGFSRIHLIVRKNNLRGIKLYRRLGFQERGDVKKEVQGVMIDFISMDREQREFVPPAESGERGVTG